MRRNPTPGFIRLDPYCLSYLFFRGMENVNWVYSILQDPEEEEGPANLGSDGCDDVTDSCEDSQGSSWWRH